ncbi:AhpC/TSA family protein [Mycolicibacterium sp. CH28]|uniref:peroxiredoxin-like family protein n=1 Tax=Mycolicibacterium sp. CH28 TaxID=2512237 RepID=UPI0010808E8E|nr:peroxiredoxin-like family protein [Mycolicibacterium sp. CH28]TGD84419.1 AhpC/TSA family protein [Mycolicibacterium sp. CH28]
MTSPDSTISEQATAWEATAAEAIPADILAAFSADQASLDAAGVPPGALACGSPMPDGDLLDPNRQSTSLAQLRRGRPAVVVFYRGAWCPYCNIALRTYQAQLVRALVAQGIELIAVSPQEPSHSDTVADENSLTFPVVSDPGNQIAAQLGILSEPIAEAVIAMAELGLDLADFNADGTRALPMPTTVLVDSDGVIRWIDIHPNYTDRSEVADILSAIERTR